MSNSSYTVFRRQFYIGNKEYKANTDWEVTKVTSNLYLSYCQSLPVKKLHDKQGNMWVLIGDAIQSKVGEPEPIDILSNLNESSKIEDLYVSWTGRWILIGKEKLHLDAVGLLGCFYKITPENIEVASVPGFIAKSEIPETYKIVFGKGIDYYSTPDSGFKNISKLLPSQVLNISTGEITFRSLNCKIPELSYERKIEYLSEYLAYTLTNTYKKTNKKFCLALTSGYDSRLLMAALDYAKLPYEAITFYYPTMRSGDLTIPKKLAKISKVNYELIRRKRPETKNWYLYAKHSTRHAVDREQEFILYQQFDALNGNETILLRGGGFEIASSKMRTNLPKEIISGDEICKIFKGNSQQAQSLNKWIDWVKKTEHKNLDWRDRFYWEQRVTGWLSSVEQAHDLIDLERLVPSNSLLFYNIMISIPEEIRLKKQHQVDMIRYLSPRLAEVAFNPRMGLIYRNMRKFMKKLEIRKKIKLQLD